MANIPNHLESNLNHLINKSFAPKTRNAYKSSFSSITFQRMPKFELSRIKWSISLLSPQWRKKFIRNIFSRTIQLALAYLLVKIFLSESSSYPLISPGHWNPEKWSNHLNSKLDITKLSWTDADCFEIFSLCILSL